MAGSDGDFTFSNLRQMFEHQKEKAIFKPIPPKTAQKPNQVLMRAVSTRTPPERRRALELRPYRDIVSKSVSDGSESDEDESTVTVSSGSFNLRQSNSAETNSEKMSRATTVISQKIFDVSSFLYKTSNVMSTSPSAIKPKLPPKKPNLPPKPSLKIFTFPAEGDRDSFAEAGNVDAASDLDNRNSRDSFDSEFEECDDFDLEKSQEIPEDAPRDSESDKDVKRISKTPRIIQEILESEQVYIANLKEGIDDYIVPFDSVSLPSALVDKKRILFSNIEVIYRLHESRFYPSLLECGVDPEKIADVFSSFIYGFEFDVYIVYILNRKKSDKLCREYADFFKELQRDQLGIGSFLTKPVQRLPKYQLLFGALVKELMKDLDENKAAIAACCRAEKHIQRLLNTVNEYC